ncbi:MAG: cytochrome c3 family protein [Thermodesulfobacteriota bacterium]
MKKSILVGTALAFALSLAVAGMTVAAAPADQMTLKTAAAKKPAEFNHKKHSTAYKCGECHHSKGADGKAVADDTGAKAAKCESCHNDTMANEKLNSFQKAAHENCKGCHKKEKEAGKNAPVDCKGCHGGT